FLPDADPDSCAELDRRWQTWDDQVIVHRNERVRIDGIGFSGIARLELLQVLQDHCRRRGVGLEFERRLPDLAAFADCDLIVGADGVNSVVREAYREPLDPSIGSGTRNALEDAIALFRAFETHSADVPAALQAFEEARRPAVDKFLNVAERSYAWYECFREKMQLDPWPFAYDYVMRGGRISY